ncbi:MAG: OB-fold nucleic acid binding domain-containing protein [Chloroflexota bacterium]|nr:OB-fold nucleic acid binding domain-containing protein [Chloroflexota bacterium]
MERALATELPGRVGERVKLQGWMHALRRMGGVSFLQLRDGSGTAQAVLDDTGALDGLLPETVLALCGTVVTEPRARSGVELRNAEVEVISPVREPLPFEINKGPLKANLDTYLDHAPVGLRHPAKRATLRLGSTILRAYGDWMRSHGFTQISTPKLVGAATEGGANLFAIEYFDRRAYLAQSPQLYKQVMVGVLERVFEVGHAYRAEPHYTTRHLNEYVSLDMEMGFIADHTDVMRALTEVLRYVLVWISQFKDGR